MRIALTHEHYHPWRGAIETCLMGLARSWSRDGHEVIVITGQHPDAPNREQRPEAQVHRIAALTGAMKDPEKVFTQLDEIKNALREIVPDIIFITNHASAGAIVAAKELNIPVVHQTAGWGLFCTHGQRLITPAGTLCANRRGLMRCTSCRMQAFQLSPRQWLNPYQVLRHLRWAWLQTKERLPRHTRYDTIIQGVDYHAWMSSVTRDLVPARTGRVIPNGVDTSVFRPLDPNAPRNLALPERYILTTSRIHNIKGLAYAIESLVHLPEDINLVIVGNSSLFHVDALHEDNLHNAELLKAIGCFSLEHRVHFVGRLEGKALVEAYSGAIAHVTPSVWYEPFGCVATEALACGTPSIVTTSTGARDLIQDGSNGFVVPRRDPSAIADAVFKIIAAGPSMRKAARETAVTKADFAVVGAMFLEVFANLIRERQHGTKTSCITATPGTDAA